MKCFNTAGPCLEELHYMLPPEQRLPEARRLVEAGHYFVIHAPRQTGKTTLLRSLARAITAEGRLAALHFTCETAEPAGDDFVAAQRAVLSQIRFSASMALPTDLQPPPWPDADGLSLLFAGIREWATACPRPLVLFFDEIDALRGESLRAVLRQLRAGFPHRTGEFARSVALCGLRDVRDYKAASGGDPSRLGTSSPFNVKVKSLRLGSFDEAEVRALYGQHTAQTGQVFTERALTLAWELTQGQPWLVNALAYAITEDMGLPLAEPVESSHIEDAKERLILERATHLDSLVARLMEPRVRRVIEPLLAGDQVGGGAYEEDAQYLRDLGLAAPEDPLRVANPIYKEIIVRVLAHAASGNVVVEPRSFILPDGTLDMKRLLTEFAAFWREQGDAIAEKMPYHEVAAQLVLLAYLQRVVNGGTVDREYGVGRRRIDVLVRWPWSDSEGKPQMQREVLEMKVRRTGEADPTAKGLIQLEDYLAQTGVDHGILIVFDRREDAPPMPDRVAMEFTHTPERQLPVTLLRA